MASWYLTNMGIDIDFGREIFNIHLQYIFHHFVSDLFGDAASSETSSNEKIFPCVWFSSRQPS